jgi:hypothetical protein
MGAMAGGAFRQFQDGAILVMFLEDAVLRLVY